MLLPRNYTTIELQHVAGVLEMIAVVEFGLKDVVRIGAYRAFIDALVVGFHVHRDQVHPAIVVDIGQVIAHRKGAGMAHGLSHCFLKSAIALVEIQVIVFVKIVGHVDVGPSVVVEVTNGDAQSKANFTAINACTGADVFKTITIVAVQTIAGSFVAVAADGGTVVVFGVVDGMVEQITV